MDYLQQASGTVAAGGRPGRRTLAGPGSPLSAADRRRSSPRPSGGCWPAKPVPAGEKLVSLFEPHADIIVKGSRDVDYGHKLNLTTGRSGLILDLVIEAGNPADSERLACRCWSATSPSMARRRGRRRPTAAMPAAKTCARAKAWGVRDMAFHKKSRPQDRRHGQEPLGLSQAAQLPRRHRGRHLLPEARPMAWRAAPGAGSTTSRPTSGPRWSPTISPSSPVSGRPNARSSAPRSGARRERRPMPLRPYRRQIALRITTCKPCAITPREKRPLQRAKHF